MSSAVAEFDEAVEDVAMAAALFVGVLFLYEVLSSVLRTSSSDSSPETRTKIGLHENALQRLEGGETVLIDRWHGHTLELSGTQVIDVTEYEDAQEDDAGD